MPYVASGRYRAGRINICVNRKIGLFAVHSGLVHWHRSSRTSRSQMKEGALGMEVGQAGTATGVGWLGALDEERGASGGVLKGYQ